MKTEVRFEEITEKWGSGCVTAMKSGDSIHLTMPKAIERELEIVNRDRVFIKICKAGDKKTAKDNRFKNLRAKETFEDLSQVEKDFVMAFKEYGDKVLESAYDVIGRKRTSELIEKFGVEKNEQTDKERTEETDRIEETETVGEPMVSKSTEEIPETVEE